MGFARQGIGVVALLALVSCADTRLSAREAHLLARPLLPEFLSFERWAGRVLRADPAFQTDAALEEQLFAPLLLERPICGAWVMADGRTWHFPRLKFQPDDLSWIRIHDPGSKMLIEVAESDKVVPDQGYACVLLRRDTPHQRPARVVVAFRAPEP